MQAEFHCPARPGHTSWPTVGRSAPDAVFLVHRSSKTEIKEEKRLFLLTLIKLAVLMREVLSWSAPMIVNFIPVSRSKAATCGVKPTLLVEPLA